MTQDEAAGWLQRAESNLAIARMGKAEGVFREDLCFKAQQAAEKALKALLIRLSGEYPRVHAFGLLIQRLDGFTRVPDRIREVVELTDYAVQMRYPGEYYPVTEEEYVRAIELADRVVKWVRRELGLDG